MSNDRNCTSVASNHYSNYNQNIIVCLAQMLTITLEF